VAGMPARSGRAQVARHVGAAAVKVIRHLSLMTGDRVAGLRDGTIRTGTIGLAVIQQTGSR
jgi:hypothetical protein